jgi:glucose/arabinose dehydrogenase
VAERLQIPWEVLFLPDERLLVTQRPGTIVFLPSGAEVAVADVTATGEGGLLGAALHPDFAENQLVYLYETTEVSDGLRNRINRYRLEGTDLTFDRTIIGGLPGARYHDGGRIAFGPDGLLYATVGDATRAQAAQDPESLAGTIIRLTPEGEVPVDNPFASPVYSYGHRNPQGLAWDANGQLWSTEHGRSVPLSGFDELNRIEPGANYGWPEVQGDEKLEGAVAPALHSGADTTWAPASLAYREGSLYFAGLRGETLYEVVLDTTGEVADLREHLVGEYGRVRTVKVGPDGLLYVTTSNRDGRGDRPASNDDRLLRINPARLGE